MGHREICGLFILGLTNKLIGGIMMITLNGRKVMGWFKSEEERKEELNNLHDKGQEDAARDKYNPPHSYLDHVQAVVLGTETQRKQMEEDNAAYEKGYEHTKKQKGEL